MKELKKMEKPELGYTELATDDVITTSGILPDPPAKSPMKNGGGDTDDGYHMGFGFGDPLQ